MRSSTTHCLVFFMICLSFSASLRVHKHKQRTAHHKLLLVSFDGFRWDYIDRKPHAKGFKRLLENGVRAKYMQPVFPTQTSPNHISIATGLYPESHGVVHNCNYNISEPGSWFGHSFYTTLAVNEWWDNGAEPIWITAVRQGLRSGGNIYPGSNATMGGDSATISILETQQTPTDEQAWHERIDETMRWFTEEDLDMVALYFEQPDLIGHAYGPDSEQVNETLPTTSRTIDYLLDMIEDHGLKDNLNVIITSDHGFETILRNRSEAISLNDYVNRTQVDFMFAYGPLGLVEPAPGCKEEVYQDLKGGSPHMQVYKKEELPERWHYKNSERVTSIVVVAEPGYSVYQRFVIHPNSGEHGYDNALENMRTSYFSIGPSFKKNYTAEPFENVHIYSLMCHLLGLEPAPNNGSLEVLKDTLIEAETTSAPTIETTSSSTKLSANSLWTVVLYVACALLTCHS